MIDELSVTLQRRVREIVRDRDLGAGVAEMMPRAAEIGDERTAMMAGIGIVPAARRALDDAYDEHWERTMLGDPEEVIVGSGVHAAIYSAVRVRNGHPKPLVLEQRSRAGGSFAVSRGPAFYLNSRNRPGELGQPGDPFSSLNFLPGSLLQPSHLSGCEYQTNDVLAFAIRSTLAMSARVATGCEVDVITTRTRPDKAATPLVFVKGRKTPLRPRRVIVAGGLGLPLDPTFGLASSRILTFEEFMARMDNPFPLRDMNRVAVVGAGDGARTVVEALTGKGPAAAMTIAALDWPQKIDWWGCPSNKADWLKCNRPRYQGLRTVVGDRVKIKPKPTTYSLGYECVLLDDVPYDYAIICTGYGADSSLVDADAFNSPGYESVGSSRVAIAYRPTGDPTSRVWQVGPGTSLPPSVAEQNLLSRVGENATSIFRYAAKTAALAQMLP